MQPGMGEMEGGRGGISMKERRGGGGVRLKSPQKEKASDCKQQRERWTTEDRLGEAYQTEVD